MEGLGHARAVPALCPGDQKPDKARRPQGCITRGVLVVLGAAWSWLLSTA